MIAVNRFPHRLPGQGAIRVLFAAALILSGCSPRNDRLEISGEVALDGAPLNRGSIRFTSVGEQKAMAAGAIIRNGAYMIPQEKGLLPGEYHLEIHSPDDNAPPVMVSTTPGGPGFPVAPDRIPREYNVESTKTIIVRADGSNDFDFDIVSRPTE
jgi:hypothetical protein